MRISVKNARLATTTYAHGQCELTIECRDETVSIKADTDSGDDYWDAAYTLLKLLKEMLPRLSESDRARILELMQECSDAPATTE